MTHPETPQQEQKNIPPAESIPDVIPPQYKGIPSEVVEELWQSKVYVNPEKNKAEAERRQQALEAIKQGEADRETAKQHQMSERYSKLPPEQKTEFPTAQTDAGKILNEHIQGKRELDDLSPEEFFVLGKLKTVYEEFKKENPDKPFGFELSRDIDQNVYNNLVQRLAFKVLEGKQRIGDQEKANEIRQELGVPAQEIQTEGLLVPEDESQIVPKQQVIERDKFTVRHALDINDTLLDPKFQEQLERSKYKAEYNKLPVGKLLDLAWTGVDDEGYEAYKKTFDFVQKVRAEQKIDSQTTKSSGAEKVERKTLRPDDLERLRRTAYSKEKQAIAEGDVVNLDLDLAQIDWKVGERFDAHGLAKISIPNQLTQLVKLLEQGIDPKRPFHTAPLEVEPEKKAALGAALGTAGGTAYKEGSFVLLSNPDGQLMDGIKYVIVNDAYYEALDELQAAYPDVEFIRADETPKRLQEIVNKIDKKK
ncbi:hypothetical protein KKA94_02575 [Patescibacteria group bacterium]|nr:hypothetical protein [Patescibacteria group bacterium]